jgi:hypothetical protein
MKPGAAAEAGWWSPGWSGGIPSTQCLSSSLRGRVRTIDVVTLEGQQGMKLINIGDTITAIITEAVLVGVEPAG